MSFLDKKLEKLKDKLTDDDIVKLYEDLQDRKEEAEANRFRIRLRNICKKIGALSDEQMLERGIRDPSDAENLLDQLRLNLGYGDYDEDDDS